MKISVLTLFPGIFEGFLDTGLIGSACRKKILDVELVNIRDFTFDKHRTVDDTPYGGGCGMVLKPEPLARALRAAEEKRGRAHRLFLTPQGYPLQRRKVVELAAKEHLMLVCGRYEGVDERFRELFIDEEISMGDFVLSGGEVAAMAVMESVGRLIPGVMGNRSSASEESFSGLFLEYPQYTRPSVFEGKEVPPVLLEGNHGEIQQWRCEQAEERTKSRRPDLIQSRYEQSSCKAGFSTKCRDEEKNLLTKDASRTYVALLHHPVLDINGQVVTTALTNLDLHDIARAARTFGLGGYFVVTPVEKQRDLAARIVNHWTGENGTSANSRRRNALDLVRVKEDPKRVQEELEKEYGAAPVSVVTTANPGTRCCVPCRELFHRPEIVNRPVVLFFGTGWGLTKEVIDNADLLLEPILGPGDYNHLSVRSAVSIYLAKLFSPKP